MTMDQKQQIALFRYSVIAPLETGTSDPTISNNEFFRQAAQKTYIGPDGKIATVGASTVEKWHRTYKKRRYERPHINEVCMGIRASDLISRPRKERNGCTLSP